MNKRFTPKDPVAQNPSLAPDRTARLLDDISRFLASAQRIVDRGKETYFDPQDDTQHLAMTAIIINLATAADKVPVHVRKSHPDIPWRDLKATRNYLAHDYAGSNQQIIWDTAVRDFPVLARRVGELRQAPAPQLSCSLPAGASAPPAGRTD